MLKSRMNDIVAPRPDPRARPRFAMEVPLTILREGRKVSARTRDISSIGAYFYAPASEVPRIGQGLRFVIDLSPGVTRSTTCRVECHGRVVRTETISRKEVGVAAQILYYSFLPDGADSGLTNRSNP